MKIEHVLFVGVALIMPLQSAIAQDRDSFTGPFVGAAVGAVDHHFVAEESDGSGNTRRFNVSQWGVGGEALAGYDLAVTNRIRIGGEGQFEFGGKSAVERNASYTFGADPRYGFSISGRAGVLVTPTVFAYAGAGYGEHRYRTIAMGNVDAAARNSLDRTASFILRAGTELRVRPKLNVRIEFEHLDGSRNQFMLGVPIRF